MILFFFRHVVITLLAFCTCQCNFYSHNFHLHYYSHGQCGILSAAIFAGNKKRTVSPAFIIYHGFQGLSSSFFNILYQQSHFFFRISFFMRFCRYYSLHVLFRLLSGDHDHMSAAAAFKPEIYPNPQHVPFIRPAGMRFFHFKFISNLYVHFIYLFQFL